MLDKFLSFAKMLPADRLGPVEDALAEIMASYSDQYDFSDAERQIIDQRVSETQPSFAHPDDIKNLFGQPFSA
ncbi:MAG: hypothetical protein IPG54_07325 [Sphingomonadales bacterium]|nr:hypothetical protein [Sphingomonadales bacterium]